MEHLKETVTQWDQVPLIDTPSKSRIIFYATKKPQRIQVNLNYINCVIRLRRINYKFFNNKKYLEPSPKFRH